MTSSQIIALLMKRYPEDRGEFVTAAEVAEANGGGGRRADFLALSCWPSSGYIIHGFEIKVTRSDWLRELAQVDKADAIGRFCQKWWLVAPPGVAKLEELPTGWGLLEATDKGLRVAQHATKRESIPITAAFMAALVRNVAKGGVGTAEKNAEYQRGYQAGRESGDRELERVKKSKEQAEGWHKELADQVHAFQKETGINITSRSYAREKLPAAAAVKFIQGGGLESQRHALGQLKYMAEQVARQIEEALEETK